MPVKIVISDDNPILIESLCLNLSLFDEIEILFTANNGLDLLAKLANYPIPQVILMDIEMPQMSGIQATYEVLTKISGSIKILMLTAFDQDEKVFEAIQAGASGYLLKGESPANIVAAIKEVLEGGSPMTASIATKILGLLRKAPIQVADIAPNLNPKDFDLTKREIEILEFVTKGDTYKQIADLLFLSDKTIKKHIENIYDKLHINSKYEAMQLANKYNWY
jgi:DNA-binding NarL/FixJ family response regulator